MCRVEERTAEQACLFVYGPVPRHKVTKQEKAGDHVKTPQPPPKPNETCQHVPLISPLSVRSTSSTPFDW